MERKGNGQVERRVERRVERAGGTEGGMDRWNGLEGEATQDFQWVNRHGKPTETRVEREEAQELENIPGINVSICWSKSRRNGGWYGGWNGQVEQRVESGTGRWNGPR